MKLNCDLCGHVLTEHSDDHAICENCGLEYGPDRLRELREQAMPVEPTPADPVSPQPDPQRAKPESDKKQGPGCFVWFLLVMAGLDLVIGTHGIVAVFCLLIAWAVSKFSKKK